MRLTVYGEYTSAGFDCPLWFHDVGFLSAAHAGTSTLSEGRAHRP
jgi:hypothetical protein